MLLATLVFTLIHDGKCSSPYTHRALDGSSFVMHRDHVSKADVCTVAESCAMIHGKTAAAESGNTITERQAMLT